MRCNICYLPIQEERSKERCPRCFNDFHKDHFAAWLLDHDYCPMCRETLSDSFREEMRPKTEDEAQRLQQILRTLDGLGDNLRKIERRYGKRIKASREEEFGLQKVGMGSYIKLAIPFILLSMFLIVVVIALSQL